MPDDELRNAVSAIVSRLQTDMEAQLARIEERYAQSRESLRQEIEARTRAETADLVAREWAAKLEQAEREAEERLRVELAEASVLADQRVAAEKARLVAEAEQAASELAIRDQQEREQAVLEATARVREQMKHELERARQEFERAQQESNVRVQELERLVQEHEQSARELAQSLQELERQAKERERSAAESVADRQKVESLSAALEEAQAALASERLARESAQARLAEAESRQERAIAEEAAGARVEERQAKIALVEQLMTAVRSVSEARSLSDTLNALAAAASSLAPRVALFIVNERGSRELQGWRATGFADPSPAMLHVPADDGSLLATAASSRLAVSTATVSAPEFAALPADRAGLAVPLTVGGKTVAVLYADDGAPGDPEAPASWPEAMQILGAHASVCLSHITAVRTAQAMRGTATGTPRAGDGMSDEDHGARRYARLLVSEIKLYNEAAVRAGREKRDLLARLGPEIERARRLYEERIPASIAARAKYFQEELVHTLADGDAALLGPA